MDQNGVLRGNSPAKIDASGRLKVPNEFRRVIEQEFGRDLFVTSLSGDNVWIYPLAVWTALHRPVGVSTTLVALARRHGIELPAGLTVIDLSRR